VRLTPPFFIVQPGRWEAFGFQVFEGGARIEGTFSANGAFGDDVGVIILDAHQLPIYRAGGTVSTRYNSRRTSFGSVDVFLPAGNYVLVVDNSGAMVSSKKVSADIFIKKPL
jgi:hypothetical protein